jgi:hypothetical protein
VIETKQFWIHAAIWWIRIQKPFMWPDIEDIKCNVKSRGFNGCGHIILLLFFIRFEFNPIKFGSKNLDSHLI